MNPCVRFLRFNSVGALGIGVQITTLWLLTRVAHVYYLSATSVAVGVAVAHNFIWHWRWTWRDRAAAGGLAAAFLRFAAANGGLSLVANLGVAATLVSGAHMSPVAANAVAICVCGLLNFWLGNEVVFHRPTRFTG